ncbi:MAG: WPE palindromic element domain-containing protein [Wolbachia sp.]
MPRHWDPGKLIVNEQTFSIKLPKSWIPVSGHWDLVGSNYNVCTAVIYIL